MKQIGFGRLNLLGQLVVLGLLASALAVIVAVSAWLS